MQGTPFGDEPESVGCADSVFPSWFSNLDDDAAAVFAAASADQVLQLGVAGEPSVVFVAVGACCAGSGGLTWEATQHSAVVRAKYRMMAAMLKDGARNVCFARAIERRVREQHHLTLSPTPTPTLILTLILTLTPTPTLTPAPTPNPNPNPNQGVPC